MIDWELLSFFIIGSIMLVSAIYVLRCEELVHSVMFLTLTFISVACLYLMLGAEYVAVIQILIYAGAVTVLILFAIMLTKREIISGKGGKKK